MGAVQISSALTTARINAAAPITRIAVANPAAQLTPILPNSVLSNPVAPAQLFGEAALVNLLEKEGRTAEDTFVLTAQHIANRGVSLSATPANPAKVEFVVFQGPEQRANVDFVVTGTSLSWAGLALELLLQAGDAITVRYIAA